MISSGVTVLYPIHWGIMISTLIITGDTPHKLWIGEWFQTEPFFQKNNDNIELTKQLPCFIWNYIICTLCDSLPPKNRWEILLNRPPSVEACFWLKSLNFTISFLLLPLFRTLMSQLRLHWEKIDGLDLPGGDIHHVQITGEGHEHRRSFRNDGNLRRTLQNRGNLRYGDCGLMWWT